MCHMSVYLSDSGVEGRHCTLLIFANYYHSVSMIFSVEGTCMGIGMPLSSLSCSQFLALCLVKEYDPRTFSVVVSCGLLNVQRLTIKGKV